MYRSKLFLWLIAYLFGSYICLTHLNFQLFSLSMNWIAKCGWLTWSLLFILICPHITFNNTGLTFHQALDSRKYTAVMGCIVIFASLLVDIVYPETQSPLNTESLFYCMIIPGLTEEVSYRGILLSLTILMLSGNSSQVSRRVTTISVIMVSLFFAFNHLKITLVPFSVMNTTNALVSLPMGLIFAMIAVRSRSLLWPIIIHNAADVLGLIAF